MVIKLNVPKITADPTADFFGERQDEYQEYLNQEQELKQFYVHIIEDYLEQGISIKYDRICFVISKGIENPNYIRFSSFYTFLSEVGVQTLSAIRHHEYPTFGELFSEEFTFLSNPKSCFVGVQSNEEKTINHEDEREKRGDITMGWIGYFVNSNEINRKKECDKLFSKQYEVLESKMVGNVYYAAIRNKKTNEVTAEVILTEKRGREFFYKAMDETMCPSYYDCPKSILKLLTPTDFEWALEWRKKCWGDNSETLNMLELNEELEEEEMEI